VDSDGGRYAARIDPNADDSHALMIRMVGGGKRVLDVGCWTGEMSAEFARRNRRVVGVEIDRDAAEQARKLLDDVVVADVTELDFEETFGPDAFDVIVFGDVLEHLADPVSVLRGISGVLADSGFVVASVPNVAHGSVRLRLLGGEFSYTDVGLLDRSHLRFFTADTVRELFEDAGFAIVELQRTTVDPLRAPERPLDPADVPVDVLEALRADPEALTYQFVVKAVRDDAARAVARLYDKVELYERELAELRGGRPDHGAGDVLRVAALLHPTPRKAHVDVHHVRDLLQHQIAARLHGLVDLRLLDGEVAVGPPGWGPDVVLSVGRDVSDPARPHVRSLVVPDEAVTASDPELDTVSAVGLWASRRARSTELGAHVDVLRATRRFPNVDKVLTVVLADEPPELLDGLVAALSAEGTFEGVVVVAPDAIRAPVARFEAQWPGRCVVLPRPVAVLDLLAVFAGSSAVLSASPFDRALAASLDVPSAETRSPKDVSARLDLSVTNGEGRLRATLALDRALDQAVAGLQSIAPDRVADEIGRLHAALAALQGRIAVERRLLADHLAELRVAAAAEASRELRSKISVLRASLDAQRDAIVQLQEDYRAALEREARLSTAHGHSFARRVRRRLGRSIVGRAKRRLGRLLRGG
jgi:2-polyprenyl-3-methyl-5-hydroxy-6-metoxy-1,4-benzoquinol methylase